MLPTTGRRSTERDRPGPEPRTRTTWPIGQGFGTERLLIGRRHDAVATRMIIRVLIVDRLETPWTP